MGANPAYDSGMASENNKKRIVGVTLCGFGRAGQIHFNGLRQNYNCKLKYIVDMINVPAVLETIRENLDKYHMQGVRPVSVQEFEEVINIKGLLMFSLNMVKL